MKIQGTTRALALGTSKLILAAGITSAAVVGGFGTAAMLLYHQVETFDAPNRDRVTANFAHGVRLDDSASYRRVASGSSDMPNYLFADNSAGETAVMPASRNHSAAVPPPIDPTLGNLPVRRARPVASTEPEVTTTSDRPTLSDSGSRYIVDASGRIVGIDGSASAPVEAAAIPRAQAVEMPAVETQTPPPEIRVATAVVVRRAQPVDGSAPPTGVSTSFDARGYLADDGRPVERAIPVSTPAAPAGHALRGFHLPDSNQFASRD